MAMHKHLLASLAVTTLAFCAFSAQAQSSIHLQNYAVTGNVTLDVLGGMGLEASAVTYARDRGTLFFVGDEGLGVVEISRTGQTLGSMAFNWAGTGSSNNDAEGLTYLGNGVLVVADERPQTAYRFSFAAGTTLALNNQPKVAITGNSTSVGNLGTEGISYDPRDGRFWSVKQDSPMELRVATLNFAVGGGTASSTTLFSGANSLFGVDSFSDIQVLGGVDALAGTAAADNLLLLSLDSKRLIEVNRSGQLLSALDLSGITTQAIEGVTIDERGVIYLVAEDSGTGASRLITLTSAVPEPGAWLLMALGLPLLALRRRQRG
jgi:uncharacterized protein YjiK